MDTPDQQVILTFFQNPRNDPERRAGYGLSIDTTPNAPNLWNKGVEFLLNPFEQWLAILAAYIGGGVIDHVKQRYFRRMLGGYRKGIRERRRRPV